MSGRKLSTLEIDVTAVLGDAHRGIMLAEQAVGAASQLSSQRAHDDLVDIRRALNLCNDVPGAAELRARFTQTLGST